MARWWKSFETQEERKAWEREEKRDCPCFKVCMRMPVKQLEKELGMPAGTLAPHRYATVYRYDWRKEGAKHEC